LGSNERFDASDQTDGCGEGWRVGGRRRRRESELVVDTGRDAAGSVGKVLVGLGWEGDVGIAGLDGGDVGERSGLEREEIRDAAGWEGEGGEGDKGRIREWVAGLHERRWKVIGWGRERLRGCSYDGGRVESILDEFAEQDASKGRGLKFERENHGNESSSIEFGYKSRAK